MNTTVTPNNVPSSARAPGQTWWREPMMWLVVGGPVAVVVAALVTVWIAVTHVDPLIDKRAPSQSNEVASARALQRADLPAGQARNHVATPEWALATQK